MSVKGLRRSTRPRERATEERAMRRIVEPSRRTRRMRQRDVGHAVRRSRPPHGLFKGDPSPEPIDREAADEQDDLRPQQRELLVEPRRAQRDLGRGRPPITAPQRRLAREALRDRGAVRQVILADAGLREPAPQLRAGTATEGLAGRRLDRPGRLTDDRDAITWRARDDRPRTLEVSGGDAPRACADARVEMR